MTDGAGDFKVALADGAFILGLSVGLGIAPGASSTLLGMFASLEGRVTFAGRTRKVGAKVAETGRDS